MNEGEQPRPERRYHLQEETEYLEQYCAGGYHPVKLGDEFSNHQYRIVHKLGFGSYSTVWLAKDAQSKKHVAIKINAATDSIFSNERRMLHVLKEHRRSKPCVKGGDYVSKLLDDFTIDGPNGRHVCLVSEPEGCSVADSKEGGDGWLFPLHIARAIAARVIMGLSFVHDAGIVHGGRQAEETIYVPHMLSPGQIFTRGISFSEYPILTNSPPTSYIKNSAHQKNNQSGGLMVANLMLQFLLMRSCLCGLGRGARMSLIRIW